MVVIRLARFGTTNAPKYRVTVADQRFWRDGRYLEVIGSYIPNPSGKEKELELDLGKAKAWIAKGAQPTDRVRTLIRMAEKSAQ